MRKPIRKIPLKKERIDQAAKYFLTSEQSTKNEQIDFMFEEQPALLDYFKYLDQGHTKDINKEIILQLVTIIYSGIGLQKIKLKKIKFSKISKLLADNVGMKNYFHSESYEFDSESFRNYYQQYKQKNILDYTYFAINNQFKDYIDSEQDALFIFYSVKTISDAISMHIK